MYTICMYSRFMQTKVVYSRLVSSSVLSSRVLSSSVMYSTMQLRPQHLLRSFHVDISVAKPGVEIVANLAELPRKWVKEGKIKAGNLGLLGAAI